MIWVFGDSHSTAFGLDDIALSWPELLAKQLNQPLMNLARAAVDNFYIYQSILQNINEISPADTVIVNWSHPSRKTFVYDDSNPTHQDAIRHSMKYNTGKHILFRSPGSPSHKISDVLQLKPKKKGLVFYDQWFQDYYSEHELTTNFQSYVDSVKNRLPNCLMFWFSKESTKSLLEPLESDLFILDYMIENKCYLNGTNYHLNDLGHQQWAKILIENL